MKAIYLKINLSIIFTIKFLLLTIILFLSVKNDVYAEMNSPVKSKIKIVIYTFKNNSPGGEFNYLKKIISKNLINELQRTMRYNIRYINKIISEENTDEDNEIDYSAKLSAEASLTMADYLVSGNYIVNEDESILIDCQLYMVKLKKIVKINVSKVDYGVFFKGLISELSLKIDAEINRYSERGTIIKKTKSESSKSPDAFTGFTFSFGFVDIYSWWDDVLMNTSVKMIMISGYWDMANIEDVKDMPVLKDISIMLTYNSISSVISDDTAFSNISSSAERPLHYNLMGIAGGFIYKIDLNDNFFINVSFGFGGMYSVASSDSDYNGFTNFFAPPKSSYDRWDPYFIPSVTINIIMNPNFFLTVGGSYIHVLYENEHLTASAFHGGLGFRF